MVVQSLRLGLGLFEQFVVSSRESVDLDSWDVFESSFFVDFGCWDIPDVSKSGNQVGCFWKFDLCQVRWLAPDDDSAVSVFTKSLCLEGTAD